MWCPKHDSKTLVRNRDSTNTTVINKKYFEFCSEKHNICLQNQVHLHEAPKVSRYIINAKTKKQIILYQNYENLAMIRLVLQNIINKKKCLIADEKQLNT